MLFFLFVCLFFFNPTPTTCLAIFSRLLLFFFCSIIALLPLLGGKGGGLLCCVSAQTLSWIYFTKTTFHFIFFPLGFYLASFSGSFDLFVLCLKTTTKNVLLVHLHHYYYRAGFEDGLFLLNGC